MGGGEPCLILGGRHDAVVNGVTAGRTDHCNYVVGGGVRGSFSASGVKGNAVDDKHGMFLSPRLLPGGGGVRGGLFDGLQSVFSSPLVEHFLEFAVAFGLNVCGGQLFGLFLEGFYVGDDTGDGRGGDDSGDGDDACHGRLLSCPLGRSLVLLLTS